MKSHSEHSLRIERLGPEDLRFALRLTRDNGWNQMAGDWRRLLALAGAGARLARWRGRRAGTTITCAFGPTAWIAMVLVARRLRGRGIGQALLADGIRFAEQRGCRTIRLDATPLGRPLYEKVGFRAQFEICRWAGQPRPAVSAPVPGFALARAGGRADLAAVCALDQAATRTDRAPLLRRLAAASDPWIARDGGGRVRAFLFTRPGRIARQIGPGCGDADGMRALLRRALAQWAGRPVFLDVPAERADLARIARETGLEVVRTFLRMCRGREVIEDLSQFHVSSGPELG